MDYSKIIHSAPDLYLILDTRLVIVDASEAYLKATQVKREDIIGRNIFDVFPENPDDTTSNGVKNLSSSLERVIKLKVPDTMAVQRYDIRTPTSNGEFEVHYWSPVNTPVLGKNNEVEYIIHRAEDVTEYIKLKQEGQKLRSHLDEMEAEIYQRAQEIQETNKKLRIANDDLEHLAYFDALTGLANRKQLYQRLKQFIELANRANWKIAVMFLDLDKFKIINDTLGHKVGDQLLHMVAKRLKEEVQVNDVIARLGGDEFVILINKIKNEEDVAAIANRILKKVNAPFNIEGHQLFVSGSIGISLYPMDGKDDVTLLKYADIAMYEAKEAGRNKLRFCTNEMINKINNKMSIENELREAIQKNKLVLHYQPQIDLKTGFTSSVEALLRFTRADGSLVFPGEFLHIAEGTGLIVELGEWVLYTACTQYQEWRSLLEKQSHLITNDFRMAVNFSTRQIKEPGFVDMLKEVLDKTHVSPLNLELEITESLMINSPERGSSVINELRSLGVRVVLDDFGLGYSSLNYLREFPIDKLKIDRSLFRQVPADATDSEIIHSIIRMAHSMNIKVVAEGVESERQIEFLRNRHCDIVQSNFFSKPLPADKLIKLLLKDPAWALS